MDAAILKNYINGKWVDAEYRELLDVTNPSTGELLGRVPLSTRTEVNRAIEAAAAAFPVWSRTPVARRVKSMFTMAELIRENEDKLCRSISEEVGKSIVDASAEVKRTIENIEVACGMPLLQQGDKLVGASADMDGEVLRVPVGVFGMIPPFNFPGMVPFWFLPYAIAAGNTFVLKPSEQVPCTMQLTARLIERCDLPPGVFNLVNGDKEASEALMTHPKTAGISFVGSSRVARIVAETCARHNKRFQALGSAKNHLVVMPDAKMDEVVRNMVTSCYGCAGQRCMASSAIVGVGDDTYRQVIDRFITASRAVIADNPLDPKYANEPMLMGPVVSAKAKRSILELIRKGVDEGAKLVLDGRNIVVPGCEKGHFIGPTIFTEVRPGMTIHKTEIFGPVVVILKAASLDDAVRIINDHEYGNGASIYTQNGYWARRFKMEVQAGMIGVNVGIPAPVAYLPFGGMKASIFCDIKAQGTEVIDFFTQNKIVTERFWPER